MCSVVALYMSMQDRYVERFTVTPRSEKLGTIRTRIQEGLYCCQDWLTYWRVWARGPRSSRMCSLVAALHMLMQERYVERFTVTPWTETLVTNYAQRLAT